MIGALIYGVLAVLCFVCVSFTIREKGPILTLSYLIASRDQKKHMDIKAEYRMLTIVMGGIGLMLLLLMIGILLDLEWISQIVFGIAAMLAIYAIAVSIKGEMKK